MTLYGLSILQGMGITLSHFIASYWVGFQRRGIALARFLTKREAGQDRRESGIFTTQYPEERLPIPERFRVLPVLIFDGKETDTRTQETERCTACGICAKVCPPQCIWITQAKNDSGKPIAKASEFVIDTDVCMNCGLCAEYCPFDAIKMDQNFELGTHERENSHIFGIDKLHVSSEYYARTHPKAWTEEQAKKKAELERKAQAAAKAAAAKAAQAKLPEGSPPR